MRIRDLSAPMGALCLAVLVSLAGCGGGGSPGPGAMPGPNTFSITIATKNMTHLPSAWGEKNSVTSSSKKVSPVAPSLWAWAPRYSLPPMVLASI